jgi:flavin-dependent dehydrogenase
VRVYYSGIQGLQDDRNEVFFDRRYLPSYLWVFPVPGGLANVGFGMLSAEIARRKVNVRQAFYDFIKQVPELSLRFAKASQVGKLEGFGLPLGSRRMPVSGDSFMLAGDAASLIDPITGDGIGNAMLSGKLAAEQAIRCFAANDFSATFMQQYDNNVNSALAAEFKARYKAQRLLFRYPRLLDVIFLAGQNKALRTLMQKGL